ncbi:probable serine/threonine-protein kinase nek3 [Trifolium pratense]|uniref:probable serine/threonine-protein kinase nek3 n=1 Tax=Trifolium pratense TaxID=57577 RepID=UPI001E691AA6|nr:probable serine/threonine-protein kinase nek3 [Trifolium pratense]
MSRAFSSKNASYLPPPPTPKSSSNKRRSPRSPLQDLNRISSSSNGSDASSSVSTEVPKGCLRFLASSSFKTPVNRPKNISKTPNSAPRGLALKQSKSNSSKENLPNGNNVGLQTKALVPNKAKKNPPCLYQWQSGKKSSSRTVQNSKHSSALSERGNISPAFPSSLKALKQKDDILGKISDNAVESGHLKSSNRDANSTPSSKNVAGSDLDVTVYREAEDNFNRSNSKTPPIHNSLSPEIQSGSLITTTPPACYGAGYIVSGVTDKRKCRPRGILTVEENYSGSAKMVADFIDDDDDNDDEKKTKDVVVKEDSPSLLPLPTEALVHWLSSPRSKREKILNCKSEIRLVESITLDSSTSPSSSSKAFWNLCDSSKTFWNVSDSSDLSGTANGMRRKTSFSICAGSLSEFQVPFDSILFSPKSSPRLREDSSENVIDENSPFSLNSIGSGNVIRTPQSDSSSDLHVVLSLAHEDNQKEDDFNPNFNSFSDVLLSETFFLDSSMPLEDSVNSSFQFDCLPYESIDLSKLPKNLDYQEPWLSSSTVEIGSQSQRSISWREGLTSQVNEMDEFDSCRCLSDEEDLADNSCDSNRVSGTQINIEVDDSKKQNCDVGLTETEDKDLVLDGLGKSMFSGAESISTDEGGLVASRQDSY